MNRLLITTLLFVFIIGCGRVIKAPLSGDVTFQKCRRGECALEITFVADSIIALENGDRAKTIFFAGKVFLLGDGFQNLWIGEIEEDGYISFEPYGLVGAPVKKPRFDWERRFLSIEWMGTADGARHKILITNKGKILEDKER